MKTPRLLTLAALLALAPLACAAAESKTQNSKSKAADTARADDYPLKTCLVSDEALDGDFITYTHREPGKPDRDIRFCCEGCIDDFKGDPAKFLKKLDAASAAVRKRAETKKKP
jgi:hypothetical protein